MNTIWIEKKYIGMLSSQLRNFKWRNSDQANFSCPFCGDSKRDKRKARAYLYLKRNRAVNRLTFTGYCHNECGSLGRFDKFLERLSPALHDEYKVEIFKELRSADSKPAELDLKPDQAKLKILQQRPPLQSKPDLLIPVGMLPRDHIAVQYVEGRLIPKKRWKRLFYTPDFRELVLGYCVTPQKTEQYEKLLPKEERLVMPMLNRKREVFAMAGRLLGDADPGQMRYITCRFDDDEPKLFGMELFDTIQFGFITEGQIDSLFLPNSLALCGSKIPIPELVALGVNPWMVYVCLDNEPRNKDIVRQMHEFADAGFRVTIWKGVPTHLKDINKMVESGHFDNEKLLAHIAQNSFQGLKAKMEIDMWKKVDARARSR